MARYSRSYRPRYSRYSGAYRAVRYLRAKLYKVKKSARRRSLLNRIRTDPEAQTKYVVSQLKKLVKQTQNAAVIVRVAQAAVANAEAQGNNLLGN